MITAHLPSGYIIGHRLAATRLTMAAAMIGSVFPDFDFIWYFLIDQRMINHHHYWVHIPGFWAAVALILVPLSHVLRPDWTRVALAFLAGVFVHIGLDTIAGDIKWLWPFSDQFFKLVNVPARQSHWVLNFILHPVFLAELLIWAIAIWCWIPRHRRRHAS